MKSTKWKKIKKILIIMLQRIFKIAIQVQTKILTYNMKSQKKKMKMNIKIKIKYKIKTKTIKRKIKMSKSQVNNIEKITGSLSTLILIKITMMKKQQRKRIFS